MAQSFKQLINGIERSNAAFERASEAKKRKMVAQDVLRLLDLGRLKARHGRFFWINISSGSVPGLLPRRFDDVLKLPELPTCQVCAIGAAMVCSTLRLDGVPTPQPDRDGLPGATFEAWYNSRPLASNESFSTMPGLSDPMSETTRKVFPDQMLRTMEHAFEAGAYGYSELVTAAGRMRAIYQNIVDNGGELTNHRRKSLFRFTSRKAP